MKPDLTLDDAVRRWQILREQGKAAAMDDLCADSPDKTADFSERLRAVASMAAFLGIEPEPDLKITATSPSHPSNKLPTLIESPLSVPGYELLGEIGRGGMGIVYLARQTRLNRVVALKRILVGGHASPTEVARFRNEARAVAQIRHKNIVQVYEDGEHDGLPYIAFEYIRGGSLDRRMTGTPASPDAAARFTEALAQAVDAAHRRGVVHRDLKPGNILLDDDGAGVTGFGVPKVTDFGLAKLMNAESNLTMTDSVMGSPSYMAPEQAEGKVREAGPAADIYSLGAILYELLTGRPPFRAATVLETLQQVKSTEPVRPSSLVKGLDRDIETIALKCLAKAPDRRYATAGDLADDLALFQRGEPIAARPVGRAERVYRWCLRNSMIAALLAVIVSTLLLGSLGSLGFAMRSRTQQGIAERARKDEAEQKRLAQRRLVELSAASGQAASLHRYDDQALLWFTKAIELAVDDPELDRLNRVRAANWSKHVAQPIGSFVVPDFRYFQDRFRLFTFHPRSQHLLTLTDANQCNVWDFRSGNAGALPGGSRPITAAAWSPDGDQLALGTKEGVVEIFRFPSGEKLQRLEMRGPSRVVSFSPNGRYIAVSGLREARVWDTRDLRWATPNLPHPEQILSLTFGESSGRLVSGCADRHARVYSVPGGELPLSDPVTHTYLDNPLSHGNAEFALPRLVDGDNKLLTLGIDAPTKVIDLRWSEASNGKVIKSVTLNSDHSGLTGFSVSPDNAMVAVGMPDGLKLLEAASGRQLANFSNGNEWTNDLDIDPAGQTILSCGEDTTVRLWSVGGALGPSGAALQHPVRHTGMVVRARFAPQGGMIATAQWDGRVTLWRLPVGIPPKYVHDVGGYSRLAGSPDGRLVVASATSFSNGTMQVTRVFDASDGTPASPPLVPGGILIDATFSPDGRTVATASSSATTVRERLKRLFEPDGRGGNVQFWDWRTGSKLFGPISMPTEPRGLAFRPDGNLLAAVCGDGLIVLLDPATGRVLRTLDSGDRSRPQAPDEWDCNGLAAFSPDGQRLVTWEMDKTVEVWDVESARLLHRLPHATRISHVAFSSDGEALVTGGRDCQTHIWDLRTGHAEPSLLRHAGFISHARFLKDDRCIITGSTDRHIRIWDRKSSVLLEDFAVEVVPHDFAYSPDHRLLIAAGDGVVFLDGRSGSMLAPRLFSKGQPFLSVHITSDGNSVVAAGMNRKLTGFALADIQRPMVGPVGELRCRAELASGHRVHESGVLVRLTSEEWAERWELVKGSDPGL